LPVSAVQLYPPFRDSPSQSRLAEAKWRVVTGVGSILTLFLEATNEICLDKMHLVSQFIQNDPTMSDLNMLWGRMLSSYVGARVRGTGPELV